MVTDRQSASFTRIRMMTQKSLPLNFCFYPPRGFAAAALVVAFFSAGCQTRTTTPPVNNASESSGTLTEDDAESNHLLPLSERTYLWDIEHLGFVVEQTVFSKLKASTNDGSLAAWDTFLAEDCVVRLPAEMAKPQPLYKDVAEFVWMDATTELIQTGKSDFRNWLSSLRQKMTTCGTSVGLVRLGPTANRSFAGPWSSVWRVRMAGQFNGQPVETVFDVEVGLVSLDEKIAEKSNWIHSVTVKDFRTFSSSRPLLEEFTTQSGLGSDQRYDNWNEKNFVPNTGGVYVSDMNNDGHLDVFVDDHRDQGRLYRGRGDGTFEDCTEASGLGSLPKNSVWTLSCWGDFDGDGDDDLITQDRIFENDGDGYFEDVTDKCNLPLTPAAGYAVGDYDLDGKVDLYVCHTSTYRVGQQEKTRVSWIDDGLGIDNVLFRNLGNWKFQDVTKETGTGGNGSSCFAAVWLHANDDDRPDLFAINEFGRNSLLINSPSGVFQDGDVDPVFGGFSMGVAAGDYDNDGHTDLYVANMYSKAGNRILANVDVSDYPIEVFRKIEEGTRGSKLYRSRGQGTGPEAWQTVPLENMHPDVGWSYGPSFVDLDSDGWLDLYATAGFKSVKRGEPDG